MRETSSTSMNSVPGERAFTFQPPTGPDAVVESYAHLRPELNPEEAIFAGMSPFALMGEMGVELTSAEDVSAEEVVIALQQACGVHLTDTSMHIMLGWIREEAVRHALYREYAPAKPPRHVMMQRLYGVIIEEQGPVATPKSA